MACLRTSIFGAVSLTLASCGDAPPGGATATSAGASEGDGDGSDDDGGGGDTTTRGPADEGSDDGSDAPGESEDDGATTTDGGGESGCEPAPAGDRHHLCVNPATGDDTLPYAAIDGSARDGTGTCWATIGRAAWGSTDRDAPDPAEAAAAGDVVWIGDGTYTTTGTGYRFGPAYGPVNDGTVDAPIRFEGVGTVVLEFAPGMPGPMIGSDSRDYIEWAGFTISEATAPTTSDTGPVTFFNCTGGSIERSVLTGDPDWTERVGDNYSGVRLEDASGVRIVDNLIVDYGGIAGDENHNGIETYRSYPVTIEHNEIVNCGAGIYMKAVNTDSLAVDTVLIRYNVFVDNPTGVRVLRMPMTESTPMLIHQNVFHGNGLGGLWLNVFDNGATDARWIRVFNNTFHEDDTAGIASYNHQIFQPNSHFLFWNNIVHGGTHAVRMDTTDVATNLTKDRFDFEHNLYFGWATAFGDLGGESASFETWTNEYGQDAADPAALSEDPRFVDAAALDLHLADDSPARELGRAVHGVGGPDGTPIPAGAYITGEETIGRLACD